MRSCIVLTLDDIKDIFIDLTKESFMIDRGEHRDIYLGAIEDFEDRLMKYKLTSA